MLIVVVWGLHLAVHCQSCVQKHSRCGFSSAQPKFSFSHSLHHTHNGRYHKLVTRHSVSALMQLWRWGDRPHEFLHVSGVCGLDEQKDGSRAELQGRDTWHWGGDRGMHGSYQSSPWCETELEVQTVHISQSSSLIFILPRTYKIPCWRVLLE